VSRISDLCDDGMCAAFAFVLAILLLLLGIEFLCRMVGHAIAMLWRSLTRPCQ
jgi:hypothetical protein